MTAPDDPSAIFVSPEVDAAYISWAAPSQGATSYVINSQYGDTVMVSGALTSIIFPGLSPSKSYVFTFQAFNNDGSSPGTVTSNPVTPTAQPEGQYGPIDGPTPTPISNPVLPSPVGTTDPAASDTAGNIVLMYLEDDSTGDQLVICPKGTGGLGITDFDPGFPTVRESVFSLPGRDGTYDATSYISNSAVSLNLLASAGLDANGIRQPAGYWIDVLASWLHPARRPRLVWQVQGQQLKQATLRSSQYAAPFTSSGSGRTAIATQVQWKNPNGVVFTRNLNQNLSATPNDGRNQVTVVPMATGSGALFNITFPVQFGLSSRGTASVDYAGQVPAFAEIDLYGGASDPQFVLEFSTDGQTFNVLPSQTLTFTGLTVNNGDILRVITGPSPSAIVYSSGGVTTNVRKYLTGPPQWWQLTPGIYNRVRLNAGTSNAGTVAHVFYYDTFLR